MAILSDHDTRDAEAALAAEVSLLVGMYVRRMKDKGKEAIKAEVDLAKAKGEAINGTAIGRAAAKRVAQEIFGTGLAGSSDAEIHPTIEA